MCGLGKVVGLETEWGGDVQASLWPCLRLLPRAHPAPQVTSCALTAPKPSLVTPGLPTPKPSLVTPGRPRGLYLSLCDIYHIVLLTPC